MANPRTQNPHEPQTRSVANSNPQNYLLKKHLQTQA